MSKRYTYAFYVSCTSIFQRVFGSDPVQLRRRSARPEAAGRHHPAAESLERAGGCLNPKLFYLRMQKPLALSLSLALALSVCLSLSSPISSSLSSLSLSVLLSLSFFLDPYHPCLRFLRHFTLFFFTFVKSHNVLCLVLS